MYFLAVISNESSNYYAVLSIMSNLIEISIYCY